MRGKSGVPSFSKGLEPIVGRMIDYFWGVGSQLLRQGHHSRGRHSLSSPQQVPASEHLRSEPGPDRTP